MSIFSAREYLRYARHIQLPEIGAAGQARLRQSRVVIVGCGGLGAPVGLYLAGAGAGHITLVDGDRVDLGNLQRQIGFSENDIGQNKAHCLQSRLQSLNSDIEIIAVEQMLDASNVLALFEGADLVVDCSDRFEARMLINDACLQRNIPWLYASVTRMSGQCALFTPGGPCFRCLFPDPPDTAQDCNTAGVLAPLPGLLGSLQAAKAIEHLVTQPDRRENFLTLVEASPLSLRQFAFEKRAGCTSCAGARSPANATGQAAQQAAACAAVAPADPAEKQPTHIGCAELAGLIQQDKVALVDVRDADEHSAFNIGGRNISAAQLKDYVEVLREQVMHEKETLVLYCHSGARSAAAQDLLSAAGVAARCLDGGMQAWCMYIEAAKANRVTE